jgi:AcrR family transcriptional regulator
VTEHGDTGLPASIAAVWGLEERPRRGPKPGLSLDRIVAAGIHVALTEGLAAVSMGRVARELGASTMALYRYVAAKDELLALMLDAGIGPAPRPQPGEGWRAGLERWAWEQLQAYRRHPWALAIPISGPPTTPNQVGWMESALALMAPTGMAPVDQMSVLLLLSGYVRNDATLAASVDAGMAAAHGTPQAGMLAYADLLRRLTDAERFPHLRAVLDAGVLDRADPPEEEFHFGLGRLLDGVELLVADPARGARGPAS